MPGTYIFIANSKVTGGATPTTISFSSIPQTFNDLVIHISHRSASNDTYAALRYTVNGASGAYSYTGAQAVAANFSATTANNQATMFCGNSIANQLSSGTGAMQIYIPQYTNATQVKVGYVTNMASTYSSSQWANNWLYQNINNSSIGGISSMIFSYANGYTFADDTQITLYGVSNT